MVVSLLGLGSCNDCPGCEPFTEEPYVKVQFLNLADSSKRVIIIDSVNNTYTKEFRHFRDTTYAFKFPLDMHRDTATFKMIYRDNNAQDTYLTNTITLVYNREFFRRDDNYLVVRCRLQELISDFTAYGLFCQDSLNCISNEATARIYN